MLNILILENNAYFCKEILNNIQSGNSVAHVLNISFCDTEALIALNNNDIHIIIINLDCCSENLLETIIKKYHYKYKSSLILYTNYSNLPNYLKEYNFLIHKIIKNCKTYKLILLTLSDLINKKLLEVTSIRTLIKNELEFLGYDFSYVGTKYLAEAIYLVYILNSETYDLQNQIYPIISNSTNTSITNIKCGIFNSTSICYSCDSKKIFEKYFSRKLVTKPRTKEIIDIVIEHLQKRTFNS